MKTFSAIFEHGVLRPLEPVCLPEHCQVQVELLTVQPAQVGAKSLDERANAPMSQRVRVAGRLAPGVPGAKALNLILDDGHQLEIELVRGDPSAVVGLVNQRVLVLGTAIFQPSGELLRVEADDVSLAHDNDPFFSEIPRPTLPLIDVDASLRQQDQDHGVSSIIGNWPGDETDEKIDSALKELS